MNSFKLNRKLINSFLFFFFVITVFWALKPLKTSSVIKAFGPKYYPLFKQGLLLIIPIVVTIYNYLSKNLKRRKLIFSLTSFFLVGNISFWLLFKFYPTDLTKISFFFYIDSYISVMVALFFTYINHIYSSKEAEKLYAYIGGGGILGGILGSSISGWAGAFLGENVILISALFLIPIYILVNNLESLDSVKEKHDYLAGDKKEKDSIKEHFSKGLKVVLNSKYLIAIMVIIGFYEIISTNIDYIFNLKADLHFENVKNLGAFQGQVFFYAQILALIFMYVITPFVHNNMGLRWGLLFLPIWLALGSAVFIFAPLLLVISLVIGGEASMNYSINQMSKEILYTPLEEEEKSIGKAFIDVFILRGAKALGATFLIFYTLYLRPNGHDITILNVINFLLSIGWIYAVFFVSKKYQGIK